MVSVIRRMFAKRMSYETMADILGGVNQRYGKPIPQQQIKNAWMYYAMSTICFPLTAFYWL